MRVTNIRSGITYINVLCVVIGMQLSMLSIENACTWHVYERVRALAVL